MRSNEQSFCLSAVRQHSANKLSPLSLPDDVSFQIAAAPVSPWLAGDLQSVQVVLGECVFP